ncbi:MAG: CehA/McbA family metallohydrolase [Planctomycetes bacterium]|nr:CehA/McbA family metallohydrolase [Planctomycetota bacterium]
MQHRIAVCLVTSSLFLGAAGCGGGGGGGGSASTAAPVSSATPGPGGTTLPPAPPGPPAGRWWKGDLHSHSAPYSQDADRQGGDPPGMCFHLAEVAGLDYLALTDHRTLDQVNDPSYRANTLTILDGEEWGGSVHIGMVGLTRVVPEIDRSRGASTINSQMQAAFDEVHRQGGIAILNHPCQRGSESIYLSRSFDAVEVWNSYWGLALPRGFFDTDDQHIDDKLRSEGLAQLGEDCTPELREAVRHRGGGGNYQALKLWEAHLNRGRKKAAVGGGDRHMLVFPGLPTTRVFAPTQARGDLLQGIREARTWVGSWGGPEVEFTADADGDGVFEAIIGDSVPLNRQVRYRVRVQNAQGGRVDVIRNGQTHLQFALLSNDDTFEWTDTAAARTWTRLDVFERVDMSFQSTGWGLLALSGQVFGQTGVQALATLGLPAGFQVTIGTRLPTIRLPHEVDTMLNFDRLNWGYARGAITSPIWAE